MEDDNYLKMTHPNFTIKCRRCNGDKTYVDSNSYYFDGAIFVSIYLKCSECERGEGFSAFSISRMKIKEYEIKCDNCGSKQVYFNSDVDLQEEGPPKGGGVRLKCYKCKNEVEIWSTYEPSLLALAAEQKRSEAIVAGTNDLPFMFHFRFYIWSKWQKISEGIKSIFSKEIQDNDH